MEHGTVVMNLGGERSVLILSVQKSRFSGCACSRKSMV